MQSTSLTIGGADLSLIESLKKEFPSSHLSSSKGPYILFIEKYDMISNTNLLAAILINFSEKECEVEVVSQSGSSGLFRAGRDNKMNSQIVNSLRKIAKAKGWRIKEI
jgi:hypothetical protein